MKRRLVVAAFVLAWLLGVAAYLLYRYPTSLLREPSAGSVPARGAVLQAPPSAGPDGAVPPPPPRPADAPAETSAQERPRELVGATAEQLRTVEERLPAGARVATYPSGDAEARAALASADLDGDGVRETVVVHTEGPASDSDPTPQLFLSVLAPEGGGPGPSSSARLAEGGVLFNIDLRGAASPLAVKDVTGDGRPEILVASGLGASLGGALQVFSFEGASLRQVGSVGGHFFRVENCVRGRPCELRAGARDGGRASVFKWNGRRF